METRSKQIELEIGEVTYTFTAIFGYYEGTVSLFGDPTEGEDPEYMGYSIEDQIHAYHNETGKEWFVTDPNEEKMVREWFSDEAEFDGL